MRRAVTCEPGIRVIEVIGVIGVIEVIEVLCMVSVRRGSNGGAGFPGLAVS